MLVDISEFSKGNDVAFCEWLAKTVGVAGVPGSSFFREKVDHLARFHFAKNESTLVESGERLKKLRKYFNKK